MVSLHRLQRVSAPHIDRRAVAWLLSLPLMVVGSQVAHGLAYRIVYPHAHVRLSELLSTGHGYMNYPAYLPMLLGVLGAAELVGLGWMLAGSLRRDAQRQLPAWAFALVPMLGFTLQELAERWLSGTAFPWWMVLQPTFRVGLLLQLPFALAAFLLARLLRRAAGRAALALCGTVQRPRLVNAVGWVVLEARPGCRYALASAHPGRGPPAGPAVMALCLSRPSALLRLA